ncbi:MAG: hypothetical protein SGJ11_13535 [Phycisphaerae bacterium]|nr:hypothetical protein [Phycisphaerae bacterium]
MSRATWSSLRSKRTVKIPPLQESRAIEVEAWSYEPIRYRDPDVIDPLSLALSLGNSGSERIESAPEQMLKDLPW